ncbi:TPA: hypothetical protein DCQ44_01605 [Candidatus Taylorbacteria bacterium]|nr:hypothetical protein [Candidatus Taylorbacteria bacterium]
MQTKIIIGVVAVVVAVGVFFGGMKYGEAQVATRVGNRTGQFANGQAGANGMMGRQGQLGANGTRAGFVVGDVLSKDNQSVTIKLQGGGSKIVFTSASTTVLKASSGTVNDLVTGTTVTVQGSTNADGSITAQSIQIRPAGSTPQNVSK